MSHRFTTNLDEDDYGDLILTIPYEICEELGWSVKTELQFELSDDGSSINLILSSFLPNEFPTRAVDAWDNPT